MKTTSLLGLALAALVAAVTARLAYDPGQSDWEARLRPFEHQLLQQRTPGVAADERRRGAEPWRLLRFEDPARSVVLLRHTSEAVLLDEQLHPVARLGVPRSPAAAAPLGKNHLLVGGELSNRIALIKVGDSSLKTVAAIEIPQAAGVRDLLVDRERLLALDDFQGRLLIADLKIGPRSLSIGPVRGIDVGPGPRRLLKLGGLLVVHVQHRQELLLLELDDPDPDSPSAVRISFEGPLLDVAVARWGDAAWLAAGGIENRPLDRSGGEFGRVDSLLYLLRLGSAGKPAWKAAWRHDPSRFAAVNLSELDLVSPRAVLPLDGPTPRLWVAGFGSGRIAQLEMGPAGWRAVTSWPAPQGIRRLALAPGPAGLSLLAVSSLTDSVVRLGSGGRVLNRWQAPDPAPRSADERLGELLLFTTLMSPRNRWEGPLSRLTCEACHLDGGIDGRVHFTGRDEVHATTKPLRGMADNVPLFSRGGAVDFASMVPAEFDALNQQRASLFTLSRAEFPWLREFPSLDPIIGPETQRRALLAFLLSFDHRPNPWRLSRQGLDSKARAGLAVFRDRCEHCHQARTTTRSRTPVLFEQWPDWLEGERDLVWGAPFFSKTGIEPYVDPAGARVPSLRRVWRKTPYFTNGSSSSIADVLRRFRYRDFEAWHHFAGPPEQGVQSLSDEERDQLEALLRYF